LLQVKEKGWCTLLEIHATGAASAATAAPDCDHLVTLGSRAVAMLFSSHLAMIGGE
jgi:hypothetical protein